MYNLYKTNNVISSRFWISTAKAIKNKRNWNISPTCSHLYHYANNNPITYTDPDGRKIIWIIQYGESKKTLQKVKSWAKEIMNSNTIAGKRFKEIYKSKNRRGFVYITDSGDTNTEPKNWNNATNGVGSDVIVRFNFKDAIRARLN